MLDIKWIRENPDFFNETMRIRGEQISFDEAICLDNILRFALRYLQNLQQEKNTITLFYEYLKREGSLESFVKKDTQSKTLDDPNYFKELEKKELFYFFNSQNIVPEIKEILQLTRKPFITVYLHIYIVDVSSNDQILLANIKKLAQKINKFNKSENNIEKITTEYNNLISNLLKLDDIHRAEWIFIINYLICNAANLFFCYFLKQDSLTLKEVAQNTFNKLTEFIKKILKETNLFRNLKEKEIAKEEFLLKEIKNASKKMHDNFLEKFFPNTIINDFFDKMHDFFYYEEDYLNKHNQQSTFQYKRQVDYLKNWITETNKIGLMEYWSVVVSSSKTNQENLLLNIPNILLPDVPFGVSEENNIVIKKFNNDNLPVRSNQKDHVALGEGLGLMDFEKAANISGSRFVILKGDLAKMERALISFMLDIATNNGYQEVSPPILVKNEAMLASGQLPKFSNDSFLTTNESRLIPTSEVPLVNLLSNEIIDESNFPIRYTAATPCFRSEAGSAGRDTRGMIRLHQFYKVELVSFTTPDKSEQEHEFMTSVAESVLEKLQLPYRRILLCSGDTGFCSAKTYDLEVWVPSQNKYREISSCSNCLDFQARRMNTKYKNNKDKKKHFVHTLNGSSLAVGRTIIAIMENYQQSDGSIIVPDILRPYMNIDIIKKH